MIIEYVILAGLVALVAAASGWAIAHNVRMYRRCARAIREQRTRVYERSVLRRLERCMQTGDTQPHRES